MLVKKVCTYKFIDSVVKVGEQRVFEKDFPPKLIRGIVEQVDSDKIVIRTEEGNKETITAEDIGIEEAVELKKMFCTDCRKIFRKVETKACPNCNRYSTKFF